SVGLGLPITASVSASGISTLDTRGANSGTGKNRLGEAIAQNMTIAFAQTAGINHGDAAPTFDGSVFGLTSDPVTSATNPVITTFKGVAKTDVTRSTTPVDNGVTGIAAGTVDVDGKVKIVHPNVGVLTGQAEVTYTATVAHVGDKSSKIAYFILTPGTNSPALTADGTLVSSLNGTKVYSALTDTNGVARLKVTSGTVTAGTAYQVMVMSNNQDDTITTVYGDASAAT